MSRAFSFSGRIRSFKYAFAGIRTMLQSQHNAWIHACATVCVVAGGLFFGIYPTLIKGAYFIAQFTPGMYKTIKLGTIDTRKVNADYIWISPPANDIVKKLWLDRIFAIRRN